MQERTPILSQTADLLFAYKGTAHADLHWQAAQAPNRTIPAQAAELVRLHHKAVEVHLQAQFMQRSCACRHTAVANDIAVSLCYPHKAGLPVVY